MESLAKIEMYLTGESLGLGLLKQFSFIRSQNAARITWHSHECFELLLVIDGATAYEFEGGKTVDLNGGHFLVIPAQTVHRGHHDVRRPASLCGLMFDLSIENSHHHTPFTVQDVRWLKKQFECFSVQPGRMSTELLKIVKKIPPDFRAIDLSCDAAAASLRIVICTILLECAKLLSSRISFEPETTVRQAIAYMESHLSEPLRVEMLAKKLHCGRAKFFQIFKASTGLTPIDYGQRLRIDRAQELLLQTDKTITQIAFDCGFLSSQYFSSVFRKYSGCTPSEYRRSSKSRL